MSYSNNRWCTIESDPAVFTEMIEKLGVKNVTAEELVTIDTFEIDRVSAGGDVYGFILLFKWPKGAPVYDDSEFSQVPNDLYFAHQFVENACATQAILNILLNSTTKVDLGEDLSLFYDFTKDLDSVTRGEQIGQFEKIRTVHNSFAPPDLFDMEKDQEKSNEGDAYHFTAFVIRNQGIYELDGLKKGLRLVTNLESSDIVNNHWKEKIAEALLTKITSLSNVEPSIHFSVCALVRDPLLTLSEKKASLLSEGGNISEVEEQILQLTRSRDDGKIENCRRRHNYVPMVMELLKALHEKGKLKDILEHEIEVERQKDAAKQDAKKGKK